MSDLPAEAVQAAAEVRLRQYESEYDAARLTWRDFATDMTEVLEAAAPHLAAAERARIRQFVDSRYGQPTETSNAYEGGRDAAYLGILRMLEPTPGERAP